MRFWRRRSTSHPLSGELLLRVQNPPHLGVAPGESVVLDEALDVELIWVETDDGQRAVAAFTSEKELLAWDQSGGPWIALEGRAAATLVYTNGFDVLVIDPASDSWGFPREQLAELLDAE